MDIRILQLIEGAREAKGYVVIIDVFRAFSTACYVVNNGAEQLFVTGKVETAFQMAEEIPDSILVGEREEKMVPGFHFGNSPSAIRTMDLSGKTVIQTTSSGTQGIIHATGANVILTGSFVNAAAIIRYLKKQNPEQVSLICMGYATRYPVEEDTFCAEYIRNGLTGVESDFDYMREVIKNTSGKRFFLPENQNHSPKEDFDLCLNPNIFDFVLTAQKTGPDSYQLIKTAS